MRGIQHVLVLAITGVYVVLRDAAYIVGNKANAKPRITSFKFPPSTYRMEVKQSRVPGAGEGLFARVNIPRGKIFRFRKLPPQSKPSCRPIRGKRNVINFYVPRQVSASIRARGSAAYSKCLLNGTITRLGKVNMCPDVKRRKYVCVQRNSPLMKANDLAWRKGMGEDDGI